MSNKAKPSTGAWFSMLAALMTIHRWKLEVLSSSLGVLVILASPIRDDDNDDYQ